MRLIPYTLFSVALIAAGCSGEPQAEKAILGTWVQETPTSTTSAGLQTTTTDTVLRLKKNGETHLSRNLDIAGRGLPEAGVKIGIELRGQWEIANGQLKQTQNAAIVIPRTDDETARKWADQLQNQANESQTSLKDIVLVDKNQLIIQDTDTGVTDVYRRK